MQRKIIPVLLFSVLLSCGEASKKTEKNQKNKETTTKEETKTLPSGNYTTLLVDYQCGMDASEFAKTIGVSESDVSVSDYQKPNFCSFDLEGFGKNKLGDPTTILWEPTPSSKDQNKREIQGALKNQEKYPEQAMQGIGIELAETGDAYIFRQPHVGRVLIYNENYDNAFLISYGVKSEAMTDRTEAQHQELTQKMVILTNYLLKKHRK
ncbi:hypothetical protein [Costertonia aggregata]|uniref:Uncharacterized protein n=1 Tax=Costertonia aggregata TaxID=343403 RepID=A0A7H9AR15_9FLAO|nr:hypothetical protein [Costertonia aggregata]QLG45931.1 hypothetical protein HYG79_11410 [Costertonia aggregata]